MRATKKKYNKLEARLVGSERGGEKVSKFAHTDVSVFKGDYTMTPEFKEYATRKILVYQRA